MQKSHRLPAAITQYQKRRIIKSVDDRLAFWEDFYKKQSLKVVPGTTNEADVARYVLCEELRREIKEIIK